MGKGTKIVLLGSRPLGSHALNVIAGIEGAELVGRVVKEPPADRWWHDDPYSVTSIPRISAEAVDEIEFDLGISVNYWKIIAPETIAKARLGFVNLHHSYNLSLRGRDMATHAILNARTDNRWYHGTTLHYIDAELDRGAIIASESCPITEWDTAWTLFQKTENLGRSILDTWLPRIVHARPPVTRPEPDHPLNARRASQPLRFIEDIHADPLRSYDLVRAFDFNGYYEPASTIDGGKRVFLTTDAGRSGEILIDLGEQRLICRL